MRVAILAYEGCLASGVSGFSDTLAIGNVIAGREVFMITTLGTSTPHVQGFRGTPVPVDGSINQIDKYISGWDVVFLPPSYETAKMMPEVTSWIGRVHDAGALTCAACAGVFYLAEAGMLNRREATTHWGLSLEFTQRYPDVRLDTGRIIIDGGDYICAGGITSYFDLALRLIARFISMETAATCARALLLDPGRSSQTPYMSLLTPVAHGDHSIAKAQSRIADNIQHKIGIKELANYVNLTERTFLRRFRKAIGRSPKEYLQLLRIEISKRLLTTSDMSIDSISEKVGYVDSTSFFRTFKAMTGITPGEYRKRFSCYSSMQGSMKL